MNTVPGGQVLIFTATYNEAGNISEWHQRVRAVLPTTDLLVVDDGSPDGTGDILDGLARQDPRLTVIHRPGKSGLGSAHKLAFAFARDHGYRALVTMDSDLSHQPEEIPGLLSALATHDFVIGTRWGEGTCEYTGIRRLVSYSGNLAARIAIPTGLSEYTTSFRAFSPQALEALASDEPPDDGYAFFMEVVFVLDRAGLALSEVPITFLDRFRGKSKIPRAQILVSATSLARLWRRRMSGPR